MIRLQDFGGICDGRSHKLSELYMTIEAARAVYPFVETLDEEIDRCAMQKAVNEAFGSVAP